MKPQDKSSSNDTIADPAITLVDFGNEIMKVIARYEGQDRVIVPLLEVMDMLLESGTLLLLEDKFDFPPMVRFVQRQTIRCKDARKLSACVRVFCGLCGLGGKIKKAILLELLRLLLHSYPKIRRATADSMYMMLSSSADVDESSLESQQVDEILTSTDWNLPVAKLTPIRDQLYPLLKLQKPAVKRP
ncbi:hypothetical protein BGW38_003795 [Lunasporangiospora selenospora]|uniref:Tubulin-folding cofactor D C-terminal domain-containing protein n=1 Tax=Lunasporangiospora selenospora TaxID=979761 RepID=A0A9P6FS96_9FUNG|nr:hypothetical protein BGW38_003795 [Lunasporangiospora selenospora]